MDNRQQAIKFMEKYLVFKSECIDAKIFDLDEISKLFEVFLRTCS